MLKKSASGVLAALRGSTYRSVRLSSSLAVALLDSLFEHPARRSPVVPDVQTGEVLACPHRFSAACYVSRGTESILTYGLVGEQGTPRMQKNAARELWDELISFIWFVLFSGQASSTKQTK
jgi:hypothetical protein